MPQFVQVLMYSASGSCFVYAAYIVVVSVRKSFSPSRGQFNPLELGFGLMVVYLGIMIFLGVFGDL